MEYVFKGKFFGEIADKLLELYLHFLIFFANDRLNFFKLIVLNLKQDLYNVF